MPAVRKKKSRVKGLEESVGRVCFTGMVRDGLSVEVTF